MIRRLGLLLITLVLTACMLPGIEQPTPIPTPTSPPPRSTPTEQSESITPAEPSQSTDTQPTPSPDQPIVVDDPAHIAKAIPGDRDQVKLAEAFKGIGDIPEIARTEPLTVKLGDVEKFWVSDNINDTNYTVTAKLRYAGPIVLMYVDTQVESEIKQEDIERSAKEFEEHIYPRDHQLFGQELSPGIDGDPRLTILNTEVRGAGGYFSSADGVVKAVNRFSNEREMFVIGIDSYPLGTEGYASTLAHEFQHMIEWHEARRSPSWFNEGMSTLAEDLNKYVDQRTAEYYLANPDIQLTTWSGDAAQTGEHYGTSQLFMRYFYEQYADESGLSKLIKADAGNNPEAFTQMAALKRPDIKSFADLYADWAVANLINDPKIDDGRYSYSLLPETVTPERVHTGETLTTVSQFGADYLGTLKGPLTINFDGEDSVALTGARPKSGTYMWWSNRGDDSIETLTREFDLTGVDKATLKFSTWYEIELNWDYGFVSVSTDNGTTWTTLKGKSTTDDDPQGQNFGNGLTGLSGVPGVEPDKGTRAKWIEEQMDLSPFAGKRILLRFWVVNDAAYNTAGMLIDNIRIPELNYEDGAENGDDSWQAQGFVRTTGELAQQWALRLVRTNKDSVEALPVDQQGRATIRLKSGEQAVLVVIATTPFTTEPAPYRYTVSTR